MAGNGQAGSAANSTNRVQRTVSAVVAMASAAATILGLFASNKRLALLAFLSMLIAIAALIVVQRAIVNSGKARARFYDILAMVFVGFAVAYVLAIAVALLPALLRYLRDEKTDSQNEPLQRVPQDKSPIYVRCDSPESAVWIDGLLMKSPPPGPFTVEFGQRAIECRGGPSGTLRTTVLVVPGENSDAIPAPILGTWKWEGATVRVSFGSEKTCTYYVHFENLSLIVANSPLTGEISGDMVEDKEAQCQLEVVPRNRHRFKCESARTGDHFTLDCTGSGAPRANAHFDGGFAGNDIVGKLTIGRADDFADEFQWKVVTDVTMTRTSLSAAPAVNAVDAGIVDAQAVETNHMSGRDGVASAQTPKSTAAGTPTDVMHAPPAKPPLLWEATHAGSRVCPDDIDYRDSHDHLRIHISCATNSELAAQRKFRLAFHNGRHSQFRTIHDESAGIDLRLTPGIGTAQDVRTNTLSRAHQFSASYESSFGTFRMPDDRTVWTVTDVRPGDSVVVTWDCSNISDECQ